MVGGRFAMYSADVAHPVQLELEFDRVGDSTGDFEESPG